MEGLSEQVKRSMDSIRRDKLNWAMDDEGNESDGVNVNEDLDEEEVGRRFTKLRPEKKPRTDKGDALKDKPRK
jgi:hypothetical protein